MSEALLRKTPVITIDGVETELKRLSISTSFKLIALINKIGTDSAVAVFTTVIRELSKNKKDGALGAVFAILQNIEDSQDEFYDFIAHLLSIKKEQVGALPIETYVALFEGVKKHPDLDVFIKAVKAMMPKKTTAAPIVKMVTEQ